MIALTLGIAIGLLLQGGLLAFTSLHRDDFKKIFAISAVWILGPLIADTLYAGSVSIFYSEKFEYTGVSFFGLFSYFLVMPFYGFINTTLLQKINTESVLFILIACFFETVRTSKPEWITASIGWTLLIIPGFFFSKRVFGKVILYGVFLSQLLFYAIMQFDKMYQIFVLPETDQHTIMLALITSMLALYIAFHVWFLVKFILLIFVSIRERGRTVTGILVDPLVRSIHIKPVWIAVTVFIQIGFLYFSLEIADNQWSILILQACFFVPPQLIAIIIRIKNRNLATNSV